MHFRALGCFLLGVITLRAEILLPWQPVDLEFQAQGKNAWWEFPVSLPGAKFLGGRRRILKVPTKSDI